MNLRVANEAEQVLVRESAEPACRTTKVQEAVDEQCQARWKEAEARLWDTRESNSAQAQQLASSLQRSELGHQRLRIANERLSQDINNKL